MSLKRCFSIAMLIVGTVIGAGFASGAEIASFFGVSAINPINALFCALLTFGGCALFLFLGSRFKPKDIGGLNGLVVGKARPVLDGFLLMNSLIVLAGMLAAFDSMGKAVVGFPMFSLLFGVLAAIIVTRGIGGLIKLNTVVLPGVIVILIVVCAMSINGGAVQFDFLSVRPLTSVVYVSMNLILAAGALISVRDLKPKEILCSSGIAAFIIGVLMCLIILALNSADFTSALPTLDMAKAINPVLFFLAAISMSASIFTTLLTAMNCLTDYAAGIVKSRPLAAFCVLAVGLMLSVLGFERVVGALYPVIGGLGVAYVLLNIIFFIRTRRRPVRRLKGTMR